MQSTISLGSEARDDSSSLNNIQVAESQTVATTTLAGPARQVALSNLPAEFVLVDQERNCSLHCFCRAWDPSAQGGLLSVALQLSAGSGRAGRPGVEGEQCPPSF